MNRRGFFTALAAIAATTALPDPERALWLPGKLISIPSVNVVNPESLCAKFGVGDIVTIEGIPWRFVVTKSVRSLRKGELDCVQFRPTGGVAPVRFDNDALTL